MDDLGPEEMAAADNRLVRLEAEGRVAAERLNISLAQVERWRWDEPVVTFSWVDSRGMWRGVSAQVQGDRDVVSIEGTAWIDQDEAQGRLRRWRTDELWKGKGDEATSQLRLSFAAVANWTTEMLHRTEHESELRDGGIWRR